MADQAPDAMMYVGVEAIPGDIERLIQSIKKLQDGTRINPLKKDYSLETASLKQAQAVITRTEMDVSSAAKKIYSHMRSVGVSVKDAKDRTEQHIRQVYSGLADVISKSDPQLKDAADKAISLGVVSGIVAAEKKVIKQISSSRANIDREMQKLSHGPAAPTATQIASNMEKLEADRKRKSDQAKSAEYTKYRQEFAGEQGAASAREKLEADRKRKEREALKPFSRSSIRGRAQEIKDQGLYGEARFVAADKAIDGLLAKAEVQFGLNTKKYNEVEHRLQRAFGKEVESRRLIGRASTNAMAQQIMQSIGSPAGTAVGADQIRESLRAVLADRQSRSGYLAGLVSSGAASSQQKEDAFKARQDVFELERRLQAVDRIEKEKEQIQKKIEKNQGSRFFGGMRGNMLNRQMEQKNAEMQKLYGGGPMGGKTSAHGAQFAAMNAAYGFQDFFQVLAQPGMGPGRAFLAAANNIGPALSAIPGAGVKANIAIGGVMAGMAGLNMLMEKESQESDRLSKSIMRQASAIDSLSDARNRLASSMSGGIGKTGDEGTKEMFQGMLGRRRGAAGIEGQLDATMMAGKPGKGFRQNAIRNLEAMAEVPWNFFSRGVSSYIPTSSPLIPSYQGFKDLAFREDSSVKERHDLFFRKPKTYTEAVGGDRSLRGQESEYRKYYEQASRAYEMRKESGGVFDQYIERIDQSNRDRLLFKDIEKNIASGGSRTISGLSGSLAAERRLGVRGLSGDFVGNKFQERSDFYSLSESAKSESVGRESEIKRIEVEIASKKKQLSVMSGVDAIRMSDDISGLASVAGLLKREMEDAKTKVRLFAMQAEASAKEFSLLLKNSATARQALAKIAPEFFGNSVFSADISRSNERSDAKIAASAMSDMPRQFRSRLQESIGQMKVGSDFFSLMEKRKSVMSRFEANRAVGGVGFGESAAREIGKGFGYELDSSSAAMEHAARNAAILEASLKRLAEREPEAAKAIDRFLAQKAIIDLRRDQEHVSNDPLLKAVSLTNRYAIEVANLNKSMEEGALLARERGFSENKGRLIMAEQAASRFGFSQTPGREQYNYDKMVASLVDAMKKSGASPEEIRNIESQARQANYERAFNMPDQNARRGAMGGRVDSHLYGGQSGRMLNFQDRIASLREQYQKDLQQAGLTEEGKKSLAERHRQSVNREIAGMAGGSSGKSTMMDSGSLWQRIQESLTSDPSLEVERSQLAELRRMNEQIARGREPSSRAYQEMLKPGAPIAGIVGEAGPDVGVAQVVRMDAEAAKKKREADARELDRQASLGVFRDEDAAAREERKKNAQETADEKRRIAAENAKKPKPERGPIDAIPLFGDGEPLKILDRNSKERKRIKEEIRQAEQVVSDAEAGVLYPPNWFRGTATESGKRSAVEEMNKKREMLKFYDSGTTDFQTFHPGPTQNVTGREQASSSGIGFEWISRQNAFLERIAAGSEKAISVYENTSERVIQAIEGSGISIS